MRRLQIVPNLITAFGLACGLFVIFKVNMVEPGSGDYEMVRTSTFLLLAVALADFFDGALARALRGESEFGFFFDPLADAISFGVAPSVLLLKTLALQEGTLLAILSTIGALSFSLSGVLRLARFNSKAIEARDNEELKAAQKKHFTGLPIPAAAAAAVSANLLLLSPWLGNYLSISQEDRAIALFCVMAILGYLMLCRLKFPSLKVLRLRVPSYPIAFFTVVGAVFVLYGSLYFFSAMFALLSWGYVAIGLLFSLIRMIAGKKSKTLAEFEPEEDEGFPGEE